MVGGNGLVKKMDKHIAESGKKINWVKVYIVVMVMLAIIVGAGTVLKVVNYVSGEKSEAVVTDVVQKSVKSGARKQTSYKVTKLKLKYEVDETEYNEEIKIQGRPKYQEGETVQISYDPEKPEKVMVPAGIYTDIKGAVLWILFVGLQVIIFTKAKKTKQTIKEITSEEI